MPTAKDLLDAQRRMLQSGAQVNSYDQDVQNFAAENNVPLVPTVGANKADMSALIPKITAPSVDYPDVPTFNGYNIKPFDTEEWQRTQAPKTQFTSTGKTTFTPTLGAKNFWLDQENSLADNARQNYTSELAGFDAGLNLANSKYDNWYNTTNLEQNRAAALLPYNYLTAGQQADLNWNVYQHNNPSAYQRGMLDLEQGQLTGIIPGGQQTFEYKKYMDSPEAQPYYNDLYRRKAEADISNTLRSANAPYRRSGGSSGDEGKPSDWEGAIYSVADYYASGKDYLADLGRYKQQIIAKVGVAGYRRLVEDAYNMGTGSKYKSGGFTGSPLGSALKNAGAL